MTTFAEFFLEYQSYIGVTKEMTGGKELLSGIGRRALDTAPDLFNKFGDIKDILELRWKWKDSLAVDSGIFTKALSPFSYNKNTGYNSLFLPITQIDMPFNVVNGEVKAFLSDYGRQPVNMVVYKDTTVTAISIGLYLRNNTFSPWVAVFSRAMDNIIRNGKDIHLIIPRFNRDQLKQGWLEYKLKVRPVNFSIGNTLSSVTPAALALLPDLQGLELLKNAGIQ